MRTIILYHPNSEQVGLAETFKHDYEARHYGFKIELVSLETIEGANVARTYDIVRYPAILVINTDGSFQQMWQDHPWPPIEEVFSYSSGR
jgi:hypothetical protein